MPTLRSVYLIGFGSCNLFIVNLSALSVLGRLEIHVVVNSYPLMGERKKSSQLGVLISVGCSGVLTVVNLSLSLQKSKSDSMKRQMLWMKQDKTVLQFESLDEIEIFLKTVTKLDRR